MSVPDRRPRLFAAVLAARDLSYQEKCYLLTVITLKPEYVDGKRRPGSKAMGPDGKFSLHVDYIARSMGGRTVNAVRGAREKCAEKQWLSPVHEATHGRPACYQVLNNGSVDESVRVRFFYSLTDAEKPHPYDGEDPDVSMRKNPTLTYRDGTDPRPCRKSSPVTSRGGEQRRSEEAAATEQSAQVRADVDHLESKRRSEKRTA